MNKFIAIFLTLLLGCYQVFSQSKPKNLPHYDEKTLYFGWYVGGNRLYTDISSLHVLPYNDSVMNFNSQSALGFQVGVLGDLKIWEYLHLRLLPQMTFSERTIDFFVKKDNSIYKRRSSFEIIYAEIPLELKIPTKRWQNFRPYLIGGMKFAYDLGSLKRKKLAPEDFLMKTNNYDMLYTLGIGFDLYLYYFKLGIELKSSFGLSDMLEHNFRTVYTDCIDKMRTQIFYINFTFQ